MPKSCVLISFAQTSGHYEKSFNIIIVHQRVFRYMIFSDFFDESVLVFLRRVLCNGVAVLKFANRSKFHSLFQLKIASSSSETIKTPVGHFRFAIGTICAGNVDTDIIVMDTKQSIDKSN